MGDTIQKAIVDSIELAKNINCAVELKFNDRRLVIYFDSDPEKVLARYYKKAKK